MFLTCFLTMSHILPLHLNIMTSYCKTQLMTPWVIFLFDFAIYKKCLLNEKTDLNFFSFLGKYEIKQNIS